MVSTHLSLLQKAREGNEIAWNQLVNAYEPLINWWLTRQHVKKQDAVEISQEVMIVLLRKLPDFAHSGNVGAFRSWLRQITANQLKSHARKYYRNAAKSHELLVNEIEALTDDRSEQSRLWDLQHDQFVIRSLLNWVQQSMEPKTVQIFQQLVLEEIPAAAIAENMGISIGSVYSSKSRVMRKIRQVASDLIDESWLK